MAELDPKLSVTSPFGGKSTGATPGSHVFPLDGIVSPEIRRLIRQDKKRSTSRELHSSCLFPFSVQQLSRIIFLSIISHATLLQGESSQFTLARDPPSHNHSAKTRTLSSALSPCTPIPGPVHNKLEKIQTGRRRHTNSQSILRDRSSVSSRSYALLIIADT